MQKPSRGQMLKVMLSICSFQFGECHIMYAFSRRHRRGCVSKCPSKKHVSRESRQHGPSGRNLYRPRSEGQGIDGLAMDQYQRPICKWQHSSYPCCARYAEYITYHLQCGSRSLATRFFFLIDMQFKFKHLWLFGS